MPGSPKRKRSRAGGLLAFELAFYERLVSDYPDFTDALTALGDAYTRAGRYEQALSLDLKQTQRRPEHPTAWYNLACSYALLGRLDEALLSLGRALELGYDDFAHLMRDPDLASLRQSPALRQLLRQRALRKLSSPTSA